jgi:mannose-6-phosphate isomerase-like protein (cupin superfamily)
MKFFTADVRELARENDDFRRVLYTGPNTQRVLMDLERREEIGEEVHDEVDQIFFVMEGHGAATIDGTVVKVKADDIIFVPRGARHNVINGDTTESLKLVTIYSPPIHAPGTVHHTRIEAMAEAHEYAKER